MTEFASAAGAPAARAVIYSMGFDHDMVQHALALVGGNEQLAITFILNGEVHDVATDSSSGALIAAPYVSFSAPTSGLGHAVAPSVSSSGPSMEFRCRSYLFSSSANSSAPLSFPNRLTGNRVSLALVADDKLQSHRASSDSLRSCARSS
jgi:hypothetical protein